MPRRNGFCFLARSLIYVTLERTGRLRIIPPPLGNRLLFRLLLLFCSSFSQIGNENANDQLIAKAFSHREMDDIYFLSDPIEILCSRGREIKLVCFLMLFYKTVIDGAVL
ncbi:hypothetical protein CEXT_786051 [Caerostris extrusa]|uniref:Secreted protein n=1 Tax=Caerostris extrusa TaxID=172846 RepID=A0AAV4VR05_CAEEX|nr:hypothetical protein CEXT_786051 [Caerostris extrusa]